MLRLLPSIFLLMACVPLPAENPSQRNPQVAAALANALDKLDRRVLDTPISSAIKVSDLVDRVGGRDQIIKTLHSAQQFGGPRWLDEQTVQVRVLVDGGRVARTLLELVRKNPSRSPIPPDALERDLKSWCERSFAATGLSSGSGEINQLQAPVTDKAWAGVSDQARRDALAAAREHAVERVMDSLRAIPLSPDKTFDQALSVPAVEQAVRGWLASRPVKSVEFQDDLTVRLSLSSSPDELWQILKPALSHQNQVPGPKDQAGWDVLEGQVTSRVAPAVGIGTVQPGRAASARQAAVLPIQPPEWANRDLDAEATASPAPGANQLKTARAAEAVAMDKLRKMVDALPLDSKTTLSNAERQDPRVMQAVDRAMKHARPYHVDYKEHGVVTVQVSVNLGDLWAQVAGQ